MFKGKLKRAKVRNNVTLRVSGTKYKICLGKNKNTMIKMPKNKIKIIIDYCYQEKKKSLQNSKKYYFSPYFKFSFVFF